MMLNFSMSLCTSNFPCISNITWIWDAKSFMKTRTSSVDSTLYNSPINKELIALASESRFVRSIPLAWTLELISTFMHFLKSSKSLLCAFHMDSFDLWSLNSEDLRLDRDLWQMQQSSKSDKKGAIFQMRVYNIERNKKL